MNNKLVVVASNFQSFIASLKSNLKLNYGICESATFVNKFYKAELLQGIDVSYVAKLENISGEEKEDCIDLVDYLGGCTVQKLQPQVAEKQTSVPDITIVKPKATRKPRTKKEV